MPLAQNKLFLASLSHGAILTGNMEAENVHTEPTKALINETNMNCKHDINHITTP